MLYGEGSLYFWRSEYVDELFVLGKTPCKHMVFCPSPCRSEGSTEITHSFVDEMRLHSDPKKSVKKETDEKLWNSMPDCYNPSTKAAAR